MSQLFLSYLVRAYVDVMKRHLFMSHALLATSEVELMLSSTL